MSRILLLARSTDRIRELERGLTRQGFDCAIVPGEAKALETIRSFDTLLVELSGTATSAPLRQFCDAVKHEKALPIIALAEKGTLHSLEDLRIDDFVLEPYDLVELSLRVKRLLQQVARKESGDIMQCDDLVLDQAKCEVTLAGKVIDLTFKEYQLLKFLMESKGRVLTREVLLNEIWGYDYFGGDRTVDVHIRRLRSKIEDASHTFVETVRNIGYRLKTNSH